MKAATAIGIFGAILALVLSAGMEGTTPMAFLNIPALVIVLGGTAGATLAAVGWERMRAVPALYRRVFRAQPQDRNGRVKLLVGFAETARRDGLLAIDDQLREVDDDFARKGLQLVVDGNDPAVIREILEAEIDGMAARHRASSAPFEQAGGFAPTMGIVGTVMGLVHVLQNLSAPETLGPAISTAFIATLLGVGSANVVFLPVAHRLRDLSDDEVELREMTLEGILAIQAGDNPRIVREKLLSYVSPEQRDSDEADVMPFGYAQAERQAA